MKLEFVPNYFYYCINMEFTSTKCHESGLSICKKGCSVRICLFLIFCTLSYGQTLPAFPGAEGFGSTTAGGRGGRILFVDNLNDDGPGSLRQACAEKGNRFVLFHVSGIIDLSKPIEIDEPFITVAGQSAPGDGICLRRYGMVVKTHDVVLRYLRFRPGDQAGAEVDGLSIGEAGHHVIVDHCSATWSVDECLSASGAVRDITIQWCIIAEALNKSVHHKGGHGYGSLVRAIGGVSLHHNLWAHNDARNPRLGDFYNRPPFPLFDVRNNVIYNYGGLCSGLTGDTLQANYIANYIKPGKNSKTKRPPIVLTDASQVEYHISGNYAENNEKWNQDPAAMITLTGRSGKRLATLKDTPFNVPSVHTASAEEAFQIVLQNAGAVLPKRDRVDERIIEQVKAGTGFIIDSQNQVGGWPVYCSTTAPPDQDNDGMADVWEQQQGLNPDNAGDAVLDQDDDGYTNLEAYLRNLEKSRDD